MKITYFSSQMPYPPTHGGRVDDWRRLKALKAAGARLHLVTWCSDRPNERPATADIEMLSTVAEVVQVWPILRSWSERFQRLARLPFWPSHVASRIPSRAQWQTLWASMDAFGPDAIWQDGLYGFVAAHEAQRRHTLPLFYRSHNIEHLYFQQQVAKANNLRDKLAWGLNLPHLKRVEFAAIGQAARYFDISNDDLAFWRSQGFTQGTWLPPLIDPQFADRLSAPRDRPPGFDVGYLGNLYAPNNVAGILWFLNEVVPLLNRVHPGLKIFIAGSQPVDAIRAAVAQAPGVTLIENAPDAVTVLRDAQVLVNPIFSGSGVNVKSVEMLFSPALLVSAPQGVAGLPEHVRRCFRLASEPADFAREIKAAVVAAADGNVAMDVAARRQAQAEFGAQRIVNVLDEMAAVVGQGRRQGVAVGPVRVS